MKRHLFCIAGVILALSAFGCGGGGSGGTAGPVIDSVEGNGVTPEQIEDAIIVKGSGFVAGDTVEIRDAAGTALTAGVVGTTMVDDTEMHLDIDPATFKTGDCDFVIYRGGAIVARSTAPAKFLIVGPPGDPAPVYTAGTGIVVDNGAHTISADFGIAAGTVAEGNHDHAGVYSPVAHDHDARYYTETEIDTLLTSKSDTGHNHDARYYTETEMDTLLLGKSDTGHNHDGRYYTEAEIDTLLLGKSDSGHNHDATYSQLGHNHDAAYINDGAGEINAANDFNFAALTLIPNLDADALDGKHASALMDLATYDTSPDGIVDLAEYADIAGDADTVDGQHAAAFASSGHNHDAAYVNSSGDVMTGALDLQVNSPFSVFVARNLMGQEFDIGLNNAANQVLFSIQGGGTLKFGHAGTLAAKWFFEDVNVGIGIPSPGTALDVAGAIRTDNQLISTLTTGTSPLSVTSTTQVANLNVDMLDGVHAVDLAASGHNHDTAYWQLTGNAGTNPATNFVGTTDNTALELKVNGARALRLEPNGTSPNVIGGYSGNVVTGAVGATIAGGGASTYINTVTGNFGTVSGGRSNTASAFFATVSGGNNSTANSTCATIGGGDGNTASGQRATVPGGMYNLAAGDYGLAAGYRAQSNHDGAFVWADSTGTTFSSTAANEFSARATGGFRFVTADGGANGLSVLTGSNTLSAIGTNAMELHVGAARALRLEPNAASPNIIGGCGGNSVVPGTIGATIGGGGYAPGDENSITMDFGTVGGGMANNVYGEASTIGGGYYNTVYGGLASTIGGGYLNWTSGNTPVGGNYATVAGGYSNGADGDYATVGGGWQCLAEDDLSTVAGGSANEAYGVCATVGGGEGNVTGDMYATVAGGLSNSANLYASAIGGGEGNVTDEMYATIAGGYWNYAPGYTSFVGGGQGNWTTGMYATVAGGNSNLASGTYNATVGGGGSNSAQASAATVAGGTNNTASGLNSTVAGGNANEAYGVCATVAGGEGNIVGGDYSLIAGGWGNSVNAWPCSVIGGGLWNVVDADVVTIAGGGANTANGPGAAIGGGSYHLASGRASVIPGGDYNTALGDYSFAAGTYAQANHEGAFVWSDSDQVNFWPFASTAVNEFSARATGGFRFVTGMNPADGSPTQGLSIPAGTNTLSAIGTGPVVFQAAGGVGVGTASPAAELDVAGTVKATGLDVAGNILCTGVLAASPRVYLVETNTQDTLSAAAWTTYLSQTITVDKNNSNVLFIFSFSHPFDAGFPQCSWRVGLDTTYSNARYIQNTEANYLVAPSSLTFIMTGVSAGTYSAKIQYKFFQGSWRMSDRQQAEAYNSLIIIVM